MKSLIAFPPEPAPVESSSDDDGSLRYDDVVQDGRIRLESAWRPTGRLLFRLPEVASVLGTMGEDVTNVLSRVTMLATEAPLAPRSRVRTTVRYRFEHTVDGEGQVDRLLFSTWLDAVARTRGGAETPAARAYGQRVFTRLHAPPGEHLVKRLDAFGPSGVPVHRATWESANALLKLPPGAELLDPAPRLARAPAVFGLSHTDLNQHVNFLMYHREVERAALARFVELGKGSRFLPREVSFGYRKPSFAGEIVRVALQAFRIEDALGVIAAVVGDDGGSAERATFREFGSARNVAQMIFRP